MKKGRIGAVFFPPCDPWLILGFADHHKLCRVVLSALYVDFPSPYWEGRFHVWSFQVAYPLNPRNLLRAWLFVAGCFPGFCALRYARRFVFRSSRDRSRSWRCDLSENGGLGRCFPVLGRWVFNLGFGVKRPIAIFYIHHIVARFRFYVSKWIGSVSSGFLPCGKD